MTNADLRELLRRPLVVAPMAGGPSAASLVVAAVEAGALAFLAAGYVSTEAMVAELAEVRASSTEAFGVNLFVPGAPTAAVGALARYLDSLGADADAVGATVGEPVWDDDGFDDKVAALLSGPPAIVSFTFGCPAADVVAAFRDAGCVVAVTVTQASEAAIAARAGSCTGIRSRLCSRPEPSRRSAAPRSCAARRAARTLRTNLRSPTRGSE